jgi:hypothetical protein
VQVHPVVGCVDAGRKNLLYNVKAGLPAASRTGGEVRRVDERVNTFRSVLRQCGLAAMIIGVALLSRRKRVLPISGEGRAAPIKQDNHEYDSIASKPGRKKPAWVLSLERYRVLIELLSSIAAVVALLALALSYQSVVSSSRSAESSARAVEAAQRGVQLQEAQLQPVFLVQIDYNRPQRGPTRQALRVISASGTFLDARAEVGSLLVVGEDFGDRALVPFIEPYWSPMDEQRDPKGRGVQIASWESDGAWLSKVKCTWQEQLGQYSDLSYVVSFVKVEYRDIARAGHQLFFRVGGRASKYSRFSDDAIPQNSPCDVAPTTELKGAILGRAETLDSSDAAICMNATTTFTDNVLDPFTPPSKRALRSAFDTYKHYRSPEFEEKCAPERASD